MSQRRRMALSLSLLMVFSMLFVQAGSPGASASAQGRPCTEDLQKFCTDVQAGKGGWIQCLKEHESELSASCKSAMQTVQTRVHARQETCHDDIAQFCEGVAQGGGRVMVCLRQHEAQLSSACKAELRPASLSRGPAR
jgi:hypothetical protein